MQQVNYSRWTIVPLEPEGRFEDLNVSFINLWGEKCFRKRRRWKFSTVEKTPTLLKQQKS